MDCFGLDAVDTLFAEMATPTNYLPPCETVRHEQEKPLLTILMAVSSSYALQINHKG
tara:strand:- start:1502 stop:1672 length:171 start_codon:yes stop_codon:yes gene_type:complete